MWVSRNPCKGDDGCGLRVIKVMGRKVGMGKGEWGMGVCGVDGGLGAERKVGSGVGMSEGVGG